MPSAPKVTHTKASDNPRIMHLKFADARHNKGKNASSILKASYLPDTKTLTVHFSTGASYSYADVPLSKVRDFEASTSRGSHLHQFIKPDHPATKLS